MVQQPPPFPGDANEVTLIQQAEQAGLPAGPQPQQTTPHTTLVRTWQTDTVVLTDATGSEIAGAYFADHRALRFAASTLLCDNASGHTLQVVESGQLIPANVLGFIIALVPTLNTITITVYTAGTTTGRIRIEATEERIQPTVFGSAGNAAVNATIVGPLGSHGGVVIEGVASGTAVPISGSVSITGTPTVNQGTSPWIVAGGGTAGTAASGVVTIQGIASMTAVLTTITGPLGTGTAGTGVRVEGEGTAGSAVGGVITIQGVTSMTPVIVNQGTSPWIVAGGGTAGSAATGVVTVQGIASMTPVQTTSILRPETANGLSIAQFNTAASQNFKNAAGQVYGWAVLNTTASIRYLQIQNTATTGTAHTLTIPLPANAGANMVFPLGIAFSLGIAVWITTAFTGTTATDGDVVGEVFYN